MTCVLGVQMSHYASACIVRDGELVAAVPQERLDRIKFSARFPDLAIRKAMEIAGVGPSDIDRVAIGTRCELFDSIKAQEGEYRKTTRMVSAASRFLPIRLTESELLKQFYIHSLGWVRRRQFKSIAQGFFRQLGIPWKRLKYYDHQTSHAAAAYHLSPSREQTLVLTCDGNGDGDCATVWIAEGDRMECMLRIPSIHSLGGLIARTTKAMGMAPYQDEYKVMGLAPWGEKKRSDQAVEIFRSLWSVDGLGFRNQCGYAGDALVRHLEKRLRRIRFDRVAYGLQRLTQDILVEWVRRNVEHHGISRIACGGGVFLNVKANQQIVKLPQVRDTFWFPAAGDDSISIGAAILASLELQRERREEVGIRPLRKETYLGEPIHEAIEQFLPQIDRSEYEVTEPTDLERTVAELLAEGEIVARCDGRMEYGPRALGNRTILANPSSLENVRTLNAMIKNRDFWMPFAGTVLDSAVDRYLDGERSDADPYMIIAYDTQPERRGEIRAATHQADGTIRPQILTEEANPAYHRLIREFEKLTGIGAVLNTSLNLHGEPMVNLPEEAFSVLARSHLRWLALGPHLVRKRNPRPVI